MLRYWATDPKIYLTELKLGVLIVTYMAHAHTHTYTYAHTRTHTTHAHTLAHTHAHTHARARTVNTHTISTLFSEMFVTFAYARNLYK